MVLSRKELMIKNKDQLALHGKTGVHVKLQIKPTRSNILVVLIRDMLVTKVSFYWFGSIGLLNFL